MRIGIPHQITSGTNHAAHAVVGIVQPERTSHHPFGGAEQATRKFIGNDSRAEAACQVGGSERTPLQKVKSVNTEEVWVGKLDFHRKIPAKVGRLYIAVLECPIIQLRRNTKCILGRIEPLLQSLVGYRPLILRLVSFRSALHLATCQIERIQAVHLRIDGSNLDVIDHGHHHRHGNGQPRTHNVEHAEQFILLQQLPGLFQVNLYHFSFNLFLFL